MHPLWQYLKWISCDFEDACQTANCLAFVCVTLQPWCTKGGREHNRDSMLQKTNRADLEPEPYYLFTIVFTKLFYNAYDLFFQSVYLDVWQWNYVYFILTIFSVCENNGTHFGFWTWPTLIWCFDRIVWKHILANRIGALNQFV